MVQIGMNFFTGAGKWLLDEPALIPARLRHIAGTRWGTKLYMDAKRLENRKESAA